MGREDQERDDHGRWSDGGGSGSSERTTLTGRGDKSPPIKKWFEPPQPRGKGGESGGQTAEKGLSPTHLGDLGEEASTQLGFNDLHPEIAQGKFDREFDSTGRVFELKTQSINVSTDFKFRPKGFEREGKLRYAAAHGLKPGAMFGIVDRRRGEIHFYWKDGIPKGERITRENGWHFAGTARTPKVKG